MRLAKHSLRPLLALFRSRGREKRVPLQQPGWTTRIQTAQSGDRRCEWTYLLFFFESFFRKKKGVEVKRKSRRQRFVERIFCLTLFAFFFPLRSLPSSSHVTGTERERELISICSLTSQSFIACQVTSASEETSGRQTPESGSEKKPFSH